MSCKKQRPYKGKVGVIVDVGHDENVPKEECNKDSPNDVVRS